MHDTFASDCWGKYEIWEGGNDDLQERKIRCSDFNEHLQVSEAPCQDLGLELMGTENCQSCKKKKKKDFRFEGGKLNYRVETVWEFFPIMLL